MISLEEAFGQLARANAEQRLEVLRSRVQASGCDLLTVMTLDKALKQRLTTPMSLGQVVTNEELRVDLVLRLWSARP